MSYFILDAPVAYTLEIKRSRFLGFMHPATSRAEINQLLRDYRERYPDASHHCWAYSIGDPNSGGSMASSDDGEPSGTAGRPMLNVLQHKNLSNVLMLVVRYFGGVKLGTGGLVRAYADTVQACVNDADAAGVLILPTRFCEAHLFFDYSYEANIRQLLDQHRGLLRDSRYTDSVELHVAVPEDVFAEFQAQVLNVCKGELRVRKLIENNPS